MPSMSGASKIDLHIRWSLSTESITQVLSGKPLNRDLDDFDEPDNKQDKSSVTSIPKTGTTGRKKGGGLKSQPQS